MLKAIKFKDEIILKIVSTRISNSASVSVLPGKIQSFPCQFYSGKVQVEIPGGKHSCETVPVEYICRDVIPSGQCNQGILPLSRRGGR